MPTIKETVSQAAFRFMGITGQGPDIYDEPIEVHDIEPDETTSGVWHTAVETPYGPDRVGAMDGTPSERLLHQEVEETEDRVRRQIGEAIDNARKEETATVSIVSGQWSAQSYGIGTAPSKIAEAKDKRYAVVVTNQGATVAYLSPIPSSAAAPNTIAIPANGGVRTIHTTQPIWAVSTGAGTTLDCQEEYV